MTKEEFFSRVMPIPESGCWIWMGHIETNGYGRTSINKRRDGTHRWAWRLFRGEPGALFVLHKCDVPSCVNPDHLFLGTQAENMADKARKGRAADRHGEKHPLHKLNDEQVRWAREMHRMGFLQWQIAANFGITQSHVSRLVRNLARAA